MIGEEFTVYGVLPESSATGTVSIQELKDLIYDSLHLPDYYKVLLQLLSYDHETVSHKTRLNLQSIFSTINSAAFFADIPAFYGNRVTKYTVRLVKAGLVTYNRELLSMKEIKDAGTQHQLREAETFTIGIQATPEVVNSLLWKINKVISQKVLNAWLQKTADLVEKRGWLMVDEFLFLVTNTHNKEDLVKISNFHAPKQSLVNIKLSKIPRLQLKPKLNPKTKLAEVDTEFHKTYSSPDAKIQHILNSMYQIEKATFEGFGERDTKKKASAKTKRVRNALNPDQQKSLQYFQRLLRDPELYVEIRMNLRNANQRINHSKLSGKDLKDKYEATQEPVGKKTPTINIIPDPIKIEDEKKSRNLLLAGSKVSLPSVFELEEKKQQTPQSRLERVRSDKSFQAKIKSARPPSANVEKVTSDLDNFMQSKSQFVGMIRNYSSLQKESFVKQGRPQSSLPKIGTTPIFGMTNVTSELTHQSILENIRRPQSSTNHSRQTQSRQDTLVDLLEGVVEEELAIFDDLHRVYV